MSNSVLETGFGAKLSARCQRSAQKRSVDHLILSLGWVLLLVFALQHPAQGQQSSPSMGSPFGDIPNFHHLMLQENESVGEVTSITQDRRGFIWVAGKSGLARYDGYRFHLYTNTPDSPSNLRENFVEDVYEDSQGELWIATKGGGVLKLDRQRDQFESIPFTDKVSTHSHLNHFKNFFEDTHGNLWIVGPSGMGKYDRDNQRIPAADIPLDILDATPYTLAQIGSNEYLIGTLNGLFRWDRQRGSVIHYQADDKDEFALPDSTIRALLKDSKGQFWVGHEMGVSRFDPLTGRFFKLPALEAHIDRILPEFFFKTIITDIVEDNKGLIWLCTDGTGLVYFDPQTLELGYYLPTADPASIRNDVVRTVFQDRAGDFWVGLFPAGVDYVNTNRAGFNTVKTFTENRAQLNSDGIWTFSEDAQGNIWIGSDGSGLFYYDSSTQEISQSYQGKDFSQLGLPIAILSIEQDSQGYLWLGSWLEGVVRYHPPTGEVVHYHPDIGENPQFLASVVFHILEDSEQKIWFSTYKYGVLVYDPTTDSFTQIQHDPSNRNSLIDNAVWSVMEDTNAQGVRGFWIATLNGVDFYDPKAGTFTHYIHDSQDTQSLSHNWGHAFFRDSQDRFWIATQGGGLNLLNEKNQTFSAYRGVHGLGSDTVFGILEDKQNNLWVSTQNGITRISADLKKFESFGREDGLQSSAFNRGAFHKTKDGTFLFGGTQGFTYFDPASIRRNNYVPPVHITELKVFDKPAEVADKNAPLTHDIVGAKSVTLGPNQSFITFTFSALNYRIYHQNQYRYKLEGLHDEWIESGSKNQAVFTNLDAGHYLFKVQASNNDGVWSGRTKSIDVIVMPVPWRTWWAYTLYAVVIALFIAWIYIAYRRKIAYEKAINQHLSEVDRLKDEFLATTSHELRTPLNGIIGLSEGVASSAQGVLPQNAIDDLYTVVNCGKRLSNLVNDILDFSKIKNARLQLNKKPIDCRVVANVVIAQCRPLALSRHIAIDNTICFNAPLIDADENRLQQILLNLVGNAIKVTYQSNISICAKVTGPLLEVSVIDSGKGMKEQDIARIFKPFEQLDDEDGLDKGGAGLGLAVTKELVEMHGGTIWATSTPGEGSTFTFTIPVSTEKRVSESEEFGNVQFLSRHLEMSAKNDAGLQEVAPIDCLATILVVDDEPVNRQVYRNMLQRRRYRILEAENGEQALDMFESHPEIDLVVLDLMMPRMSGFDVCEHLRKRFSINELPIIIASASGLDKNTAFLESIGASDFLLKPVNKEELISRVAFHLRVTGKQKRELS